MISIRKIYFYLMPIFLLLGGILNISKAFAQDASWPPKEWRDSVHVRYFKGSKFVDRNFYGKIVLKDGDTLRGIVRTTGFGCMFLENAKFKSLFIPVEDINYVVGDNVISLGRNFYVLKKFYKRRDLYRLIEQKGNIAIYDLQPNDFKLNTFGTPMFIVIEGKLRVKIYGGLCLANKEELILKFINKHYHQSFQKEHFKTGMDMIEYILDMENKGQ